MARDTVHLSIHIRAYNSNCLEIGGAEIPIGGSYREATLERLRPFEA